MSCALPCESSIYRLASLFASGLQSLLTDPFVESTVMLVSSADLCGRLICECGRCIWSAPWSCTDFTEILEMVLDCQLSALPAINNHQAKYNDTNDWTGEEKISLYRKEKVKRLI